MPNRMSDPLGYFREITDSPADAIKWACVLEATAPKPGNVFPAQSFSNLSHCDFIQAAEVVASVLPTINESAFGKTVYRAVRESLAATQSNANLGIILLLAPLVVADMSSSAGMVGFETGGWQSAIGDCLSSVSQEDSYFVMKAIAETRPGGLNEASSMDVNKVDLENTPHLVDAMRYAASRDRIAVQYADNYADLIDTVVPVVETSIDEAGDVLRGIVNAHIRLLQQQPDSLIARKNGDNVAKTVQCRAERVDCCDAAQVNEFDSWLRTSGNALNPGTTADLIAASLYILLRTSK